jgi:hypothetical protein
MPSDVYTPRIDDDMLAGSRGPDRAVWRSGPSSVQPPASHVDALQPHESQPLVIPQAHRVLLIHRSGVRAPEGPPWNCPDPLKNSQQRRSTATPFWDTRIGGWQGGARVTSDATLAARSLRGWFGDLFRHPAFPWLETPSRACTRPGVDGPGSEVLGRGFLEDRVVEHLLGQQLLRPCSLSEVSWVTPPGRLG